MAWFARYVEEAKDTADFSDLDDTLEAALDIAAETTDDEILEDPLDTAEADDADSLQVTGSVASSLQLLLGASCFGLLGGLRPIC